MKDYCTQNNGDCSTCSLLNYGKDCRNNPLPAKQKSFRLSEEEMEHLAAIAEHYFGKSDKMQTAALKILIEAEYKRIKGDNNNDR